MKYSEFLQLDETLRSKGTTLQEELGLPKSLRLNEVEMVGSETSTGSDKEGSSTDKETEKREDTQQEKTKTPADPKKVGTGGAGATAAAVGAGGVAGAGSAAAMKAAIAKGIFGALSSKALLFGVGGAGGAAIAAWVLRRQIIKVIWFKKLKNNATKVGKQIDALLYKNIEPMFKQKDEILKREKLIDQKLKETKDENTIKRLNALKAQLNKATTTWEQKFVKTVNEIVDTLINNKTKELEQRIDALKNLKPGQKISIKTLWATILFNLKTEGWANLTKLNVITGDEILKSIAADIEKEKAANKQATTAAQKELAEKYKTLKDINIDGVDFKYGQWYTYEKAEGNEEGSLKGDKYVRFVIDPKKLGEGEENTVAEVIEVDYDKNGKMIKRNKGNFDKPEELTKIIKNANLTAESTPVELDKPKKEGKIVKMDTDTADKAKAQAPAAGPGESHAEDV